MLLDGGPAVNITYGNSTGTGNLTDSTFADPQVSTGTVSPILYCVDLWHNNPLGSTYTLDSTSSLSYSATSSFTDVDNRIGYLMSLSSYQTTADGRAALQLALWYTIDYKLVDGVNVNFSYTGGDATVASDYAALTSFADYNTSLVYTPSLYQAEGSYQNMVLGGGSVDIDAVPEPTSLVLGAIGTLCFAGLYWFRRPVSGDKLVAAVV